MTKGGQEEPILEVIDLKKHFPVQKSFFERLFTRKLEFIKAVDGISFQVKRGEIFTLAGESGCGKTTTGRLILRLIEPTEGHIIFRGKDITHLEGESIREIRRHMQIIFQDPYASLNPRMRVGEAVGHPLEIHRIATGEEKRRRVKELLEMVGLSPAEKFYDAFPHQLSGGQRQRVAVARAMALSPELMVADEPVSMIDVSIRAVILELMMHLRNEFNLTYLFITHDLAVAKYISDRIAIMYLGKVVEMGGHTDVFKNPLHPYTRALLSAIPVPDPKVKIDHMKLKGEVPSPVNIPSGCRLHPRCPYAFEPCPIEEPELIEIEKDHFVSCHLHTKS
ncbi:MAG: ABC transporter ATP-binding protein [Candidatus Bathyarchaeia archaeon]